MRTLQHIAAVVATLAALGCAVDPATAPRDCTPGASVACACPGASGVQTCTAEGELSACECPDAGVMGDASAEDAPPSREDAPQAAPDAPDVRAPMPDAGAPREAATVGADAGASVEPARDVPVVCTTRYTCGADCVSSFQSDARHCGFCGNACPVVGTGTVPACAAGRCSYACAEGFVPCGFGRCVDPRAPGFDCARCDFQCPLGQVCRILNADRSECGER